MNFQNLDNWVCPKCAAKNLNNYVRLKQINSTEALYICEGKQCLYPLEALKKFPVVRRDVGAIPVTEELLKILSLPVSLAQEPDLTESKINELLELNSLKPHIKKIMETKEAWDSFIKRMIADGEDVPEEFMTYKDADLDKLQNIEPSMLRFSEHIFNDADETS